MTKDSKNISAITRSSAAEYLTFIAASGDQETSVEMRYENENIWLTQKMMAELYGVSVPAVNQHLKRIFEDGELNENSVIKDYLITASDGKKYEVAFYSLDMVLAVGFRVRSKRGTQFRTWANRNLKEYMVKGFLMDDDRLKNPDGRPDYFDELLERIRDIRASEKRFYQKIRDLFKLSSDYDATDKATQMFFAETQNKLLYAVTNQTAAEIIVNRADSDKPNMALTSWKGNIVRKQDVFIAKNYLTEDEIDTLNRLTVLFLESAELHVRERKDLTLGFWKSNVDVILAMFNKKILKDGGSITNKEMESKVSAVYDEYDNRRRLYEAKKEDIDDDSELLLLEEEIIRYNRKK
jgi:hypothetical protein